MTEAFGDRMKRYELPTRTVLPPRTYTILRVDGRAFHTLCRDFDRPYDQGLMNAMDDVAENLCKEIGGSVLAYTQSDEVSVLFTDLGSVNSQPWFGGVVAKQVSVAASIATVAFNRFMNPGGRWPWAQFDARVFTIPQPVEVANYFIWRQRDAVRNSIQMAAQHHFSHKQLQGLNSGQLQEKLHQEAGVNWNDYPAGFKRGRMTIRKEAIRSVEYADKRTGSGVKKMALRSWWETEGAPHFKAEPGNWLVDTIEAI